MAEEVSLTYSKALSAFGLNQSMISCWRKKENLFAAEPNRDLNYIMNMDQTPVFHAMDFCETIDRVGVCTVNLCTLCV
jgi:hypothetical protein